MRFAINFDEALQDSPKFRRDLYKAEFYSQNFELILEKLIYQTHLFQEASKLYSHSFKALLPILAEFSEYFAKANDIEIKECLMDTLEYFTKVKLLQENLADSVNRCMFKYGTYFINSEIKPLHENKKCFDKLSDDLDVALIKNSQISRSKTMESEESCKILKAHRSYFGHTVLDYSFHINKFAQSKRLAIINLVLSLIKGHETFFESGHQLLRKNSSNTTPIDLQHLEELAKTAQKRLIDSIKLMEERHCLVKEKELSLNSSNINTAITYIGIVCGYLFKRTTGKFKSWNRRWFLIKDNQLVYCRRTENHPQSTVTPNHFSHGNSNSESNDYDKTGGRNNEIENSNWHQSSYKVMEPDLRLCSVKPATDLVDRRFCFEVISPLKSHILQADSESLCQFWISALQSGISSAYNEQYHVEGSDSSKIGPSASSLDASEIKNNQQFSNESLEYYPGKKDRFNVENSGLWQADTFDIDVGAIYDSRNSILERDRIYTIQDILNLPGNSKCCDCDASNPEWASINIGITLCIECSGIHRSLGVHKSKVRSIYLDVWDRDHLKIMVNLGNLVINSVYSYSTALGDKNYETNSININKNTSREDRETFIRSKYIQKKWMDPNNLITFLSPAYTRLLNNHPDSVNQQLSTNSNIESGTAKIDPIKSKIDLFENFTNGIGVNIAEIGHALMLQGLLSFANESNCSNEETSPWLLNDTKLDFKSVASALSLGCFPNKKFLFDVRLLPAFHTSRFDYLFDNLKAFLAKFNTTKLGETTNSFVSDFTPLHFASLIGNASLVEYFLLNCSTIQDVKEAKYQFTPLHLATINGHTNVVCRLIKRGADIEAKNKNGLDSLTLAIASQNADIVTLRYNIHRGYERFLANEKIDLKFFYTV
ncbi:arf-GAP with coiled-coil, ANK repeat and PH domain-containing protein 2-like isoform X2 [Gordionus sp. m RMFG-2023]|uniref:arf-GAP with coiled-coil, ANK repeat and PH domain-containing protein 2-like isoform X2 n=1 Tax=Gordionus sp. m RMFG-2023 TaxID=3053472 RepID=UPI0031FE3435